MATVAPPKLLEARRLLLDHLDIHPGKTVPADLDPAEVGVVGDPAHIGGYHCGKSRLFYRAGTLRDYSVVETARDRAGLSDYASAMDIGQFDITVEGKRWTLPDLSVWLVAQCKAGAPDTADIREVIYSPDGRAVKRWDRLGRRTSGDSSHLYHTHLSEFRDGRGRHMPALMRRWLTHIGLLAGKDDDVLNDADKKWLTDLMNGPLPKTSNIDPKGTTRLGVTWHTYQRTGRIDAGMAALRADVATALGRDPVDEAELAEALWAKLPEQDIPTVERVLRAGMTAEKLAELAARLAT